MPGIKIKRKNAPNTEIDYNETENEFRFSRDSVLSRTAHDEVVVGDVNQSTGTAVGFKWTYDANTEELVLEDADGNLSFFSDAKNDFNDLQ